MEKIVDTTLSLATPRGDFSSRASGCQVFDPLMVLWVIQKYLPHYRKNEIDEVAANCFLNFKDYWSETEHFFVNKIGGLADWNAKHCMGTPLYMAQLLLDQEYFKETSALKNWRCKLIT